MTAARPAAMPQLSFGAADHPIHVFPTVTLHNQMKAVGASGGPLTYHGGPIMGPSVTIYNIFWTPNSTLGATFEIGLATLATYYSNHALGTNNTQYYSGTTTKTWINAVGANGGTYIDTAAYPTSGCVDSVTPSHCLTDTQLKAEITRVMNLKGWTGGLNKMYMLYTQPGAGSCFDSSGQACSYTYYCAYHSSFTLNSQTVIYANEPYGDPTYCQISGAPSPHNNPGLDTTATSASHEISEAITDPLGSSWYDSQGNEIGDICAYIYGNVTWDNNKANQYWSGYYYLLQQEYSNHQAACVTSGP